MRPVNAIFPMKFGYGKKYPPELAWITQDGLHHGFDYWTPIGSIVTDIFDGIVNFAGYLRGFGLTVIKKFWVRKNIFAWDTYRSINAHLSEIFNGVVVGKKIWKGTDIALTGDTGYASGPHLHFEVQKLKNGIWVPVHPRIFKVGD